MTGEHIANFSLVQASNGIRFCFAQSVLGRSMNRTVNGGGASDWLPREATKPRAVRKAKARSPARRIAESCRQLDPASGGQGSKQGVGSEGLVSIARDGTASRWLRPRGSGPMFLAAGSHQRAEHLQDTALGDAHTDHLGPSYSARPFFESDLAYRAASQKNSREAHPLLVITRQQEGRG